MEECLKEALKNGQIKNTLCKIEIVELLEESKADVKADPHLYKSCIKDLAQYCSSVAEGNGRRNIMFIYFSLLNFNNFHFPIGIFYFNLVLLLIFLYYSLPSIR